MKRSILGIILLCVAGSANAMQATTNPGYLACQSEQALINLVRALAAEDRRSFNAIALRDCRDLPAGRVVTVTDGPKIFRGRVGFLLDGNEYWAPYEALDYRGDEGRPDSRDDGVITCSSGEGNPVPISGPIRPGRYLTLLSAEYRTEPGTGGETLDVPSGCTMRVTRDSQRVGQWDWQRVTITHDHGIQEAWMRRR